MSRQPENILNRMDAAVTDGCRLILVIAPAGSGRSALLREWISTRRMRAAWFELEYRHNAPKCFWQDWLAGMNASDLQRQGNVSAREETPTSFDLNAAMVDTINSLSHSVGRLVLVLQNYDWITAPTIHAAIDLLLSYPPRDLLVAMTSQIEPPLAIPRLRARRQLLEVGAADLAKWRLESNSMTDL